MKTFRRRKRTTCPLCQARLTKVNGSLHCDFCRIEVVGDSCRFPGVPVHWPSAHHTHPEKGA